MMTDQAKIALLREALADLLTTVITLTTDQHVESLPALQNAWAALRATDET
jgi:hypothetical protein